jgi:hypothetical protein
MRKLGLAIRLCSHMKHASYGEIRRSLGDGGKPDATYCGDRPWYGSDGTKKGAEAIRSSPRPPKPIVLCRWVFSR